MLNKVLPPRRAAAIAFIVLLVAPTPATAASVHDVARYIAGMPVTAGSPLAPLMNERNWQYHAQALGQAWARIEKNQLGNIRAWSKENLPSPNKQMLYMFSGPDFLYANAFYPYAETYVLSALEPVGHVPVVAGMSAGGRASALQELRASMHEILSYSFFRTSDMKNDMRGGRVKGNLPVLLVFIARAGHTVERVEHIRLNPNGLTVPPDAGQDSSSPGVRITFRDSQGNPRALYYFQTDLSNGGLRNSGFRAFSKSLGPADSLIKSASYLLHSGNFKLARDFLLKQSEVIIEDASGIPLSSFPKSEWEFHPFGRYAGPISIFAQHYQHDMARLFAKAKPINFGIGYRWRRYETHTLLAIKKKKR